MHITHPTNKICNNAQKCNTVQCIHLLKSSSQMYTDHAITPNLKSVGPFRLGKRSRTMPELIYLKSSVDGYVCGPGDGEFLWY